MGISAELVEAQEAESQMPTPGSYNHLEYLNQLEPHLLQNTRPDVFLSETNASKTLAVFIKRSRIFRPIRTSYIELDSRVMQMPETWIPLFHGSVYRSIHQPDRCHVAIIGRSQPWENGEENFSYSLMLPIDFHFNYDASRPAQASFMFGEELLSRQLVYDQVAFPEYGENDPTVLYSAIKQASSDLAMLARYIRGIDSQPGYVSQLPKDYAEPSTSRKRVAQTIANLLK